MCEYILLNSQPDVWTKRDLPAEIPSGHKVVRISTTRILMRVPKSVSIEHILVTKDGEQRLLCYKGTNNGWQLIIPDCADVLCEDTCSYSQRPPEKYGVKVKIKEVNAAGKSELLYNILVKHPTQWELAYGDTIHILDSSLLPTDFLCGLSYNMQSAGWMPAGETYLLLNLAKTANRVLPIPATPIGNAQYAETAKAHWGEFVFSLSDLPAGILKLLSKNLRTRELWNLGNGMYMPKEMTLVGMRTEYNIAHVKLPVPYSTKEHIKLRIQPTPVGSGYVIPLNLVDTVISQYSSSLVLTFDKQLSSESHNCKVWGKQTAILKDGVLRGTKERAWLTMKEIDDSGLLAPKAARDAALKDLSGLSNKEFVYPREKLLEKEDYYRRLSDKFTLVPAEPELYTEEEIRRANELNTNPDLLCVVKKHVSITQIPSAYREKLAYFRQKDLEKMLFEETGLTVTLRGRIEDYLSAAETPVAQDCAGNLYYKREVLSYKHILQHPVEAKQMLPQLLNLLVGISKVDSKDIRACLVSMM